MSANNEGSEKDLGSSIGLLTEFIKAQEVILARAEKWPKILRYLLAIVSLGLVVLLLSGLVPISALMAFGLVILAVSLIAVKPKVLEAQVFGVKDEAGKLRALFGTVEGAVTMGMFDEKGQIRLAAGLADQVSLGLFDETGRMALAIGLSEKNDPGVTLFDANSQGRVALALIEESGPVLSLIGNDGKAGVLCSMGADDASSLTLKNNQGAEIRMQVTSNDQGIWIMDRHGDIVANLRVSEIASTLNLAKGNRGTGSIHLAASTEGPTGLVIQGQEDKRAIVLASGGVNSGHLVIFDKDGKPSASLP